MTKEVFVRVFGPGEVDFGLWPKQYAEEYCKDHPEWRCVTIYPCEVEGCPSEAVYAAKVRVSEEERIMHVCPRHNPNKSDQILPKYSLIGGPPSQGIYGTVIGQIPGTTTGLI